MADQFPPLPLYVIVRSIDWNEEAGELAVTPQMPYPAVVIEQVSCFPLFTSVETARWFMNTGNIQGTVVCCKASALYSMLEVIKPPAVTIDPDPKRGKATSYVTASIVEWLARECGKQS